MPLWPMLSTMRLLSSGVFMVHSTERFLQNKGTMAGSSLFNGVGLNSWENVWGIWNGMTPRDSEIYRRVAALLRFAGGHTEGGAGQADDRPSHRRLLRTADWRPFWPSLHASNGRAVASTFAAQPEPAAAEVAVPGILAEERRLGEVGEAARQELFIAVLGYGSGPPLFPMPGPPPPTFATVTFQLNASAFAPAPEGAPADDGWRLYHLRDISMATEP